MTPGLGPMHWTLPRVRWPTLVVKQSPEPVKNMSSSKMVRLKATTARVAINGLCKAEALLNRAALGGHMEPCSQKGQSLSRHPKAGKSTTFQVVH